MATFQNQAAKLQYIDSLRGAAIIMVITSHVGDVLRNLSDGIFAMSDSGVFGVQLFFVVSAFTLCLTMDERQEDRKLTKFYLRRYFRIAPLYYCGILLYFTFYTFQPILYGDAPSFPVVYTLPNIAANLLLVNDLFPGHANNSIVPGGWSIGTETTFYLIFPLILFLYQRIKNSEAALIAMPLIGLALSLAGVYFLDYTLHAVGKVDFWNYIRYRTSFLYFSLLCQLPVFLIGMSIYFMLKKHETISRFSVWASAAAFVAFAFFAIYLRVFFKTQINWMPFTAGISFIFLFILFREVPALSKKWLSRIGELSYSIYLLHFMFAWEGTRMLHYLLIEYFSTDIILILGTAFTLLITVKLAELTERYIEKPGIALGKRIIGNLRRKPALPNTINKSPAEPLTH